MCDCYPFYAWFGRHRFLGQTLVRSRQTGCPRTAVSISRVLFLWAVGICGDPAGALCQVSAQTTAVAEAQDFVLTPLPQLDTSNPAGGQAAGEAAQDGAVAMDVAPTSVDSNEVSSELGWHSWSNRRFFRMRVGSGQVVAELGASAGDPESPKSVGAILDEAIDETLTEAFQATGPRDLFIEQQRPYTAYRTQQSGFHWLAAANDDLGWFSWQSEPYTSRDTDVGLGAAFNLHWLSGPVTPDVSPRLYDAVISYQVRGPFSSHFSYDAAVSVGVFSDFAGSARNGVRFPAHAVGMVHLDPRVDLVFGIDYLDRDDIKLLPVLGVSIREFLSPNIRLDLVFPRPRIDLALDAEHRIYLAGSLGGGTWDFRTATHTRELLTYRDYRVVVGFEFVGPLEHLSSVELGYAFSRQVSFAEAATTESFPAAFVLQWVGHY